MPHIANVEAGVGNQSAKIELYRSPSFITLYRYENPANPYDEGREGIVSKKGLIGAWYTDNLSDLKTYTAMRVKGQRGGKFVVVRVKREDLDKYEVTKLPETKEMDIETGSYIIPTEVAESSKVEIEGIFKDSWEGKQNIPLPEWKEVGDYINANLSDKAVISRLSK